MKHCQNNICTPAIVGNAGIYRPRPIRPATEYTSAQTQDKPATFNNHAENKNPIRRTPTPIDNRRAIDTDIWTLTFRPTGDGPPTEIRIRRLLKHALRALGLRCVRVAGDEPKEVKNAK